MSDVKCRDRPATAYGADFHAWSKEQAARLRELRPNSIDLENIAEEIEGLGGSQRREIRSRLLVLARQYEIARLEASGEAGFPLITFPETCPFTIDEVLDPSFWPDAPKP